MAVTNTAPVSVDTGTGNSNNLLLIIAIVAVIVSAIAFFVVLGLNNNIQLAPAVGEEGTAQISIITNARIDTTTATIDFGAGFVNPGTGTLVLDSNNSLASYANWLDSGLLPISIPNEGFVIENIGNVDLDLDVELETALDTWLAPGPSATSVILDYKLNNCDTTSPAIPTDCTYTTQFNAVADTDPACVTFNVGTTADTYEAIPVGSVDETCDNFTFSNDRDEVRLDLRLTLPEDIAPTGGVVTNRVIIDIDPA